MFVFGDTPAQAARMGYDIAQQNRQALTRANELEADYAFRTNQMENAAAQSMAALARAQQQEQNQLAREAFVFGEQAKRQAQEDAFNKLRFDTQRKDVERKFAFEEKQLKADEMEATNEAENTGITLAEALTRIVPAVKEARAVRDAAVAAEKAIIDNARMIGYGYDEAKKKIVGAGRSGTADDYNSKLSEARLNLKAAKEALTPMENELAIAERQARQFKFAVTPDAVTDIVRRKSYKIGVPASPLAAAPAAGAAMEFPTGTVGSVTPPANRSSNLRIGPDGRLIPPAGSTPPRAATPTGAQPDSQDERQDFDLPATSPAPAGLPQGQQQQTAVARQRPYTFGPGLEQAPFETVKSMYDAQAARIRANNAGRGAPLESEVPSTRFGFPRSPVMESLTDPIANKLAEVLRISPQQIGQSTLYRTAAAQAKALLEGKYGDVIWDELSEEEKRTILVEALQNSQRDPYTRQSGYTGFEFR